MMKKVLGILLTMVLVISATASLAEQLPSPTIPTTIKAQVSVHESSAAGEADFEVWLEGDTEMSEMLLAEIESLTETEKLVYFFNEETLELAKEYLPEDFDIEKLMLAEVYSMSAVRYALEYGDVDAIFEFAAEYEDGTILLAMIGVVVAEAESEGELPEIMWFPIQAAVNEGRVILTIPQEVLESISDDEPAYFVLLQNAEDSASE